VSDLLTRAIVSRLSELHDIALVIKSVIDQDAGGYVTFGTMAQAIAPQLGRVEAPRLHRDIRAACRLLGLSMTLVHGGARVIRGVKLR
jgi:hypothetical protein